MQSKYIEGINLLTFVKHEIDNADCDQKAYNYYVMFTSWIWYNQPLLTTNEMFKLHSKATYIYTKRLLTYEI